MKQRQIYLIGRTTDLSRDEYYDIFATASLRVAFSGSTPLNPVLICETAEITDRLKIIEHRIKLLIKSDGVYYMKDWKKCNMCLIENEIVQLLKNVNPNFIITSQQEEN